MEARMNYRDAAVPITREVTGITRDYRGTLGTAYIPFQAAPITDGTIEGPMMLPMHKKGRISGWGEPSPISQGLDTARIQAAISAATRGEMTMLFQIYRDFLMNGAHLQTEFGKRKRSVVGQPHTIKPWKPKPRKGEKSKKVEGAAEDIQAADMIEEMIDNCENWEEGLIHLMDAALWPVAVHEKIFEPNTDPNMPDVRFKLKRFDPVSPFLFAYKLAYMASGGFQLPNNVPNVIEPNPYYDIYDLDNPLVWNPDEWEPDLRFFRTFPNGMIDYSWAAMYAPNPIRHMVHRGTILSRTIRDNYGGVMRGCLFWHFFSALGRDWFSQKMEKWGAPFIVAKANSQNVDTINFLRQAFRECISIGGLLVNKDADVEMIQAMSTNMAEGYKIFLDFCNGEMSKLIVGHEGSSTAKEQGLNSNQEETVQNVLEDIRILDQMFLKHTLEKQLFEPYLRMNGNMNGHVPSITWGGLSEEDATELFTQIGLAKTAGLELTDEAIEHVSEVSGIEYQREVLPEPAMAGAGGGKSKPEPK